MNNDSASGIETKSNRGRKRKYLNDFNRRRIFIIPRLLKRDIRRDLAIMYINTFNSSDGNLLKRFLKRYSTQDICFRVNHHIHCPPYYNDIFQISTFGIDEKLLPYNILTSSFPDICSSITEIKLINDRMFLMLNFVVKSKHKEQIQLLLVFNNLILK